MSESQLKKNIEVSSTHLPFTIYHLSKGIFHRTRNKREKYSTSWRTEDWNSSSELISGKSVLLDPQKYSTCTWNSTLAGCWDKKISKEQLQAHIMTMLFWVSYYTESPHDDKGQEQVTSCMGPLFLQDTVSNRMQNEPFFCFS